MPRAISGRQAAGLALLGSLALLAGCGNPWARPAPVARWAAAMALDDYDAAESLLVTADTRRWRAETEQLAHEHGRVRAATMGEVAAPPGEQPAVVRARLVWEDGYARCLLLRDDGTGHLALADGGYRDCPDAPAP